MKKTLISLISLIALSSCGSTDYSLYNYQGKIGAEDVSFTNIIKKIGAGENILKIRKSDGKLVISSDEWWNDLKIEQTTVIQGGKITTYTEKDELGKIILGEAQKQYDSYLQKIKDIKVSEGINSLR
jgi:hypothetical protein